MIQYLFALLGVLLSPVGIAAFAIGVFMFIFLPVIPRATNQFHAFARLHQWLGANMLKRAAIVVSKQGDLLLKRMSPTDSGTEKIKFQDDSKEFEYLEGQKQSPWHWAGIPFALAEEVHGFLFDPRHAALGKRVAESEEKSEMVVKATEQERSLYGVQGWVKGALSFPSKYELADLNQVRQLVTGSERAEHPQKITTFYELSREPYKSGGSTVRYILLIAAMVGPFALLGVLADQFGGGGGGGSTTVGYGFLALLAIPAKEALNADTFKRAGVALLVILPLPLLYIVLVMSMGILYPTLVFILLGAGFWFVPILTFLLRSSTGASNAMAEFLLKLGFMGYDKPVFTLTAEGYEVKEYEDLDTTEDVVFHSFLGRITGFTFTPSEEMWGTEVAAKDDLENRALGDGGAPTNIPSGYSRIPEHQRAVYGVFVPSRIKSSKYYLWTGVALETMKHIATGEKSHNALREAKEEHGGLSNFSHKSFTIALSLLASVSFLAGLVVFFL